MFNFSMSFVRKMPNGRIYMCCEKLLQKMSIMVNSHDLLSLLNMSVVFSNVPSSLKTTIHENFSF